MPPIKLPTNISGSRSIMLFMPTENSGVEVSSPRTKKERKNEEILKTCDILMTALMISPAPSQIVRNDRIYRTKLKGIVIKL